MKELGRTGEVIVYVSMKESHKKSLVGKSV